MKIVLLADIAGLGKNGEIKEVSAGHAKNFLIPKRLAMPATAQALRNIQNEELRQQEKIKKNQAWALKLKEKLDGKIFTIKAKASKETLFAAVHEKQIAQAINQDNHFEIKPDQIILGQPLKQTGEFPLAIKLAPSIHAQVKIKIEAS